MVDAIRKLAAGDSVIDRSVTGQVMAEFARRQSYAPQVPHGHVVFTAREKEVLSLLASGRSNAEIASALYVEPTT